MMTQPRRPDWNLIVAIISVAIGVVLTFPSFYDSIEKRFLLQNPSSQPQQFVEPGKVTW